MSMSKWVQQVHRKTGRAVLMASALSALALLSACGDEKSGGGGKDESFTLKMGSVLPLTGALSPFGPPGRKAEDLARDRIEAAIAEAGADIDVELEHADGESDPQASVQAVRRLLADDPGCILGSWTSASTIAVANSATVRERVPLIAPSTTNPGVSDLDDDDFVWRTSASDALGGVALANLVEERLGGAKGKTISLAARNDDYGEGFIDIVKEAWEARGGKTTGPVMYDPDQPAFAAEAGQIVAGDPDAFVVIDYPDTYAKLGPALVRTGKFDPTRMFSANPLGSVAEGEKVAANIPAPAIVGVSGHRPWTPAESDAAESFNELYTSAPGPKRNTYDGQAFDATLLCFLAAVAAGSADPEEINKQLRDVSGAPGKKYTYRELPAAVRALQAGKDIDYEGVSGPIDFDENGDPASAYFQVWTYVDGEKLDIVGEVAAEAK